ncbi:putative protease YoaZ [Virgibacillus pantothenticus]|uniref:type 1 glutamine amidotransferase family protein n=1 Tax=Virgibacillus pantothenticus TaxID=1473 RepID=UPI001B007EF2|nr:type 1 glutamine amidotransferase family protein [Virgibacillus pantothenticus]MBU8567687.1 glutamine amidotransferase [Virgibacillus pantothenticus]MBU8602076.1 glutamine amidotransferase [Virgibacillus pantothenticus]MBU8635713.1 glutamine amidotransferase [Virgibacillus pantothenticus]MBU8643921.1 glutamine amidotransferase [Virgibacillus pantothenticus]MBU8648207.1 glutamine amidotransferase [Virgibacillus pantothenticus]
MKTIYIYVLDTLADWELGYVTAELNSRRFFKEGANQVAIKTVSNSKQAISTMGGMTIVPDYLIDDIIVSETSMLLLPGADTWNDPKHEAILVKASELLSVGATVCAICGATAALANFGILDNRPHTSNGPGFLEMVCSDYKGQDFYIDQPSIASNNLITAGSTEALLWTKQIIECLDVFKSNTLESWYNYFNTGDSKYFFELMQTLTSNNKN